MKSLRQSLVGIFVPALLLVIIASMFSPTHPGFAQDDEGKTPDELCEEALPNIQEPENRTFDSPEAVLEEGVDYRAIFCTESGAIFVNLLEEFAPITVNNFVFLAQNGYYNNTSFHRVLADFMIQGGDPTGTGRSGPGYSFQDEFVPFLTFATPGWLAMANAGPNTNGSQFFITRVPTPHLNGRHTIFGQVYAGQDVVDNMRDRNPEDPSQAATPGAALNTVLIVTAEDNIIYDFTPAEVATAEEIDVLLRELPIEGFAIIKDSSGIESREFEEYGSATATAVFWAVETCPADPDLYLVGFRMIDWGTADVAAQVMTDSDFVQAELAPDFTNLVEPLNEGYGVTNALTYCEVASTQYRYIWSRNRYVMILDFILPDGLVPAESMPIVINNFAGVFERTLGQTILAGFQQ
jgi:cyclophilin family peptidyl-prolyl cis-trans isomerase